MSEKIEAQSTISGKVSKEYELEIIDESISDYWNDFEYGQTKDQLTPGLEVSEKVPIEGTITTNDLVVANRVYTLSFPNPDGEIFSLEIDGNQRTFKIGFFNDETLAYTTLTTELTNWITGFGIQYSITYSGSGNYELSRLDGTEISVSRPNLVKQITLIDFNEYSKIDVIVDGVTVTLDGPTHSGSASDAITYLESQLSSSIYYMNDDSNVLVIARKDGVIPVITKTQYDRYTYELDYSTGNTPSAGDYLDYNETTIDGTTFTYTMKEKDLRRFPGDEIIRDIVGYDLTTSLTNTTGSTTTDKLGISIDPNPDGYKLADDFYIKTVTKDSACTATKAYIRNPLTLTVFATATFVGDVATFNYNVGSIPFLSTDKYEILLDNNGSSYTYTSSYSATNTDYNVFEIDNGDRYNINNITWGTNGIDLSSYTYSTEYTYSTGTDSSWISGRDYFGYTHTLNLYKSDFSTITASSTAYYTDLTVNSGYRFDLTETNHIADIVVDTYTEITITDSLSGNNYYIKTSNYPKKITIEALSSIGSSTGTYELGEQGCNFKYGTTVGTSNSLIFKTGTGDFGSIVGIKQGGFFLQVTTTVNNTLKYICT